MENKIRLPEAWSRYKILDLIGTGAYGSVYEAEDTESGEVYAIKILSVPGNAAEAEYIESEYGKDADAYCESILQTCISESKLLHDLKSCKNIVQIFDYSIQKKEGLGWDLFIRMELLNELSEISFDERKAIRLGIDICQALEACEKCNILHRDVKPANILVDDDGFLS